MPGDLDCSRGLNFGTVDIYGIEVKGVKDTGEISADSMNSESDNKNSREDSRTRQKDSWQDGYISVADSDILGSERQLEEDRWEDGDISVAEVMIRCYPGITSEEVDELIKEGEKLKEEHPYKSMLARFNPDIDLKKDKGNVETKMTRLFDEFSMREDPYPKDESRGRYLEVNAAYKRKDKKVRPVDANDGTGRGPGGRADWYERSKIRGKDQPPIGKYGDLFLPRFATIERGSRLTPEKLKALDVGTWLWAEERAMFDEMILNREGAIGFEWEHINKIHEDVSPPIEIKTIPHEAWQERNFPCPKALVPVVIKICLDRMKKGVFEKGNGPYRNPWFLVAKKKPGDYRFINAAMKINGVTMRDANMPPSVDEFSEEFAGCKCASLVDFFSGYDQLDLHPKSRDLTGFMTPLGLLRMTTLPQGATNSVAQFVRVVMTILEDLFPNIAMPFLDDIGVKGPYTDYDGEEKFPGVRRFVYEHLINLDRSLERIERAQATIGPKSQFCCSGMVVVGFVCGAEGRSPMAAKVATIVEWGACEDVTHVKAFLGICVYYRIWIEFFSLIAEPLYLLCKKNQPWIWGEAQEEAMDTLKEKLVSAPLLCKLHYDAKELWGLIFLGVDASLRGWGAILGQYDDKNKRRVARYESGMWNDAERNYDATKRECRGVLKALKKVRYWLFGVHFILEIDAKTLVAQLNRAATDVPGALIVRWLAWIRLFDFEVRHVKGSKHTAADGLSRRPRTTRDDEEEARGEDIDDFIAGELDSVEVSGVKDEKNW